jgi:hypothetical protein
MKHCSKCNNFKSLTLFGKCTRNRDGLKSQCKDCRAISRRQRYEKNKTKVLLQKKTYYNKNRIKELAQNKAYRRSERGKEKRRKRQKIRLETDVNYRLMRNHRCRIWHALRGISKEESSKKLLGCQNQEYSDHIAKQFLPGMTFDHKDVVIDHMIPLRSFDLSDPEERRKSCHYTNLQPLWAKDNGAKSDKEIYDMVWIDDHWHIKLGDKYVSRKEQVEKGISTHDYYPISTFYL